MIHNSTGITLQVYSYLTLLSVYKVARNFLESGAKPEDPIGWSIAPLTSLNQQDLSDPMVKRLVQTPLSCGAGSNQGVLRPVSVQNQAQPHSSGSGENHSSGSIFGRRNSSESKRPMVGNASCKILDFLLFRNIIW